MDRQEVIINFRGENFGGMLKPIIGRYGHINFVEETFAGGSKTANVFSLKGFALYGTCM